MTALAADRATPYKEGDLVSYPVEEATTLYLGGMVSLNAAGYAIKVTDAASIKFVGIAQEGVDNSAGADGAKSVQVRQTGVHTLVGIGLAIANSGDKCFAADDQTVEMADEPPTNFVMVGRLSRFIDATTAPVDIVSAVRTKNHGVAQIQAPATGAFTDPPSAAEMALLRTLVNEMRTNLNT